MAKIEDVLIPYLQLAEGVAPGTPATGNIRFYAKADGNIYSKNDAGLEVMLGTKAGVEKKSILFYIDDVLEVGVSQISIIAPQALIITEIRLAVDTSPTGAALIIDINKNGTTLYTTQANRPSIAIEGTSAIATLPDVVTLSVGDKLTLDIDQVGSTVAGENLSVIVICEVI